MVMLPGNHDEDAAITLRVALGLFYRNNPRVEVYDKSGLSWYSRFGQTLLGAHHGHTMKADKMAMMLATDRAKDSGLLPVSAASVRLALSELQFGVCEAVKSLSPRSRAMSWQGFVDSVLRADHPQPVRCDESARFCVSSSLIHRCVPVLRSSTGPYRKLGIRL